MEYSDKLLLDTLDLSPDLLIKLRKVRSGMQTYMLRRGCLPKQANVVLAGVLRAALAEGIPVLYDLYKDEIGD